MPINTDFGTAITNITANAAKLDTFINGNSSATVSTPNGPVKSIANIVNEVGTLVVADAAITEAKLSSGAVTEGKLANNAVTADKIAANSISAAKISDSAVTTAKIVDGATTTAKIADSATTTPKIADGATTSAKIADGAVTSAKIADGAVTSAKIAPGLTLIRNQWVQQLITPPAAFTALTPFDDTVPLISEGNEIFSLPINPTSTADTLTIDMSIQAAASAAGQLIISIFINSDTCSYATYTTLGIAGATTFGVSIPGIPILATGSQLVRVRAGMSAASNLWINRSTTGTTIFGGKSISSLRVLQVAPNA